MGEGRRRRRRRKLLEFLTRLVRAVRVQREAKETYGERNSREPGGLKRSPEEQRGSGRARRPPRLIYRVASKLSTLRVSRLPPLIGNHHHHHPPPPLAAKYKGSRNLAVMRDSPHPLSFNLNYQLADFLFETISFGWNRIIQQMWINCRKGKVSYWLELINLRLYTLS